VRDVSWHPYEPCMLTASVSLRVFPSTVLASSSNYFFMRRSGTAQLAFGECDHFFSFLSFSFCSKYLCVYVKFNLAEQKNLHFFPKSTKQHKHKHINLNCSKTQLKGVNEVSPVHTVLSPHRLVERSHIMNIELTGLRKGGRKQVENNGRRRGKMKLANLLLKVITRDRN